MIELANYLGKKADSLLTSKPFCDWQVTRSVDDESDPPEVRYNFEGRGIQFNCDRDDERINHLFLEKDGYAGTVRSDLSFDLSKSETRSLFGPPAKSGDKFSHPVLGEFGPWDRFNLEGFVLHLEYLIDQVGIRQVTLMREDAVP